MESSEELFRTCGETHWELGEHVENSLGTKTISTPAPWETLPQKKKKTWPMGAYCLCLIGSKNVFARLMVRA
jgi:hypothetical protein